MHLSSYVTFSTVLSNDFVMVCEMLYIMSTILSLAGHRDTWAFLERRIKDAVDCRKTAQEVTISTDISIVRIVRHE